ncbi:MAG TPA: acyl-CoA dehydrogenase family protein [Reyranella sp.]|nr:acyl-CoA dehydrogenase family protein [Reyranella sp.]
MKDRLEAFFAAEILPRHRQWSACVARRQRPPFLPSLQAKARAAGLWNLGLADCLSNRDYAPLAEIMGRLPWAPEVFNCQAPDVPNMIMLRHAATPAQKQRWLEPLLEGRVRSAFGMTEPDVASSDATNIVTTLTRDGGDWVVNGRKWYITGAAHPDCAFVIVIGVSRPEAPRTGRHSCVIVPMPTPGLRMVRELRFMAWEDSIAPIAELEFRDVRVPAGNLLGEEGAGFAAAQVRLGPARLHHCMRLLGTCEVLVELMMARAGERTAFGRKLIDYDATQQAIARSRIEIEQARLLVWSTAGKLDREGHQAVWRDVSMVKVAVPEMAQRVADRAIQIFGAMGGSDDSPIHRAFAMARLLRIADGPDEVHLRQIFRQEPPARWSVGDSPYITPPEA